VIVTLLFLTEKLQYLFNDGMNGDISKFRSVCPCNIGFKSKCKKAEMKQKLTIIPWSMVHTAG
jgi:hypothetical protein